jgi:cell division septum initiation protein DivIVA
MGASGSAPRLEELRRSADGGYDAQSVAAAFDTFRRNLMQLSAELRVLKAAAAARPHATVPEPDATTREARMSAMRIVRAAAEFADAIEREAQEAATARLGRIDSDLERRQRNVVEDERRVLVLKEDLERNRDRYISEAEAEAVKIVAAAQRQADNLSANVQAEVDETLSWARAHAASILSRVHEVTRQLLQAAALGPAHLDDVTDAIVGAARAATVATKGQPPSLIAPLYESLEAARHSAITRAVSPSSGDDPIPPTEPDESSW